jgi:hypothetical protein
MPIAVVRAEAGGDQVRGEQLPDTTTERSGSATTDQLSAVEPSESDNPLPWLANLSPAEYQSMRRWFARERGWRVTFLDRLYREARCKAGGSQ